MKLHNRNSSYLNTLPEGAPEPNIKPRITRWIYFGILLFVAGYVVYVGTDRVLFSEATGQVDVETIIISAALSGRIESIPIRDGQTVKKGDLIAKIAANRDCIEQPDKTANQLSYDIELNKSRLDILRIRLRNSKKPEEFELLRRALEVSRDQKVQHEKARKEQQQIREKMALLSREIKLQKEKLSLQTFTATNKVISVECEGELVFAPFDGVIQAVLRRDQEFSKRGDPIAILTNTQARVNVFARFKQADIRFLTVGKTVKITFPNGEESRGLVDTVYSVDYAQSNGGKITKKENRGMVRVRLSAMDDESRQLWRKYDRMDVIVRARK